MIEGRTPPGRGTDDTPSLSALGEAPSGTITRIDPERLAAASEQLETVAPGYLAAVRRARASLGAHGAVSASARHRLGDLSGAAQVDVEVPTASQDPAGHLLKAVIKRLIGWYLRYLGIQVNELGVALTRFGEAVVHAAEDQERRTAGLEAEVVSLRERIGRLERRSGR